MSSTYWLPMALRAEPLRGDPGLQAFLFGPVVLAGDLGTEDLSASLITGPPGPRLAAPDPIDPSRPGEPPPVPDVEVPALRATQPLEARIHPGDGSLEFRAAGQRKASSRSEDVTLKPFNTLLDRRYNVYWRVT